MKGNNNREWMENIINEIVFVFGVDAPATIMMIITMKLLLKFMNGI